MKSVGEMQAVPMKSEVQQAVEEYIKKYPQSWTIRIMQEELSMARGWSKSGLGKLVRSSLRSLGFTGTCALVPQLG